MSKIILLIWSGVHDPWQVTSEANEHTFGEWRYVRREFDIAKEVSTEETRCNYINTVFAGGLNIFHTNVSGLRGYHITPGEYVEILHKYGMSGLGVQWLCSPTHLQ